MLFAPFPAAVIRRVRRWLDIACDDPDLGLLRVELPAVAAPPRSRALAARLRCDW
ncbi:MAG: hypothetical protein IPJ04_13915 [Candidatus Eisenbacteria bacterium]|nr:hypothetical protein [Candidatus Eisenbacteria bacterium]